MGKEHELNNFLGEKLALQCIKTKICDLLYHLRLATCSHDCMTVSPLCCLLRISYCRSIIILIFQSLQSDLSRDGLTLTVEHAIGTGKHFNSCHY